MELYLLAILGVLTLVFLTFIVTWFFQQRAQGEIVRKTLLDFNKSLEALWGVEEKILSSLNFEEIVDKIANIVLTELNYLELGYVVVVLALIDKEKNVLRRISLSSTPEAQAFLKEFKVHFRDIVIPLSEEENLGIKAIKERRVFIAHDVSDLLYPAMKREHVRDLQKRVGIKTSVVFPVFSRGKVIGHIIFSMKKNDKDISPMEWSVLRSFTSAVGISVENAQLFDEVRKTSEKLRIANEKLKELDKLKDEFVSIASHELRTPMTAIKSYLWMVLAGKAGPLSEKMQKYLERAYVSVDRLIDLVNNMLNVSRIESGRIELEKRAINLSELVEDVIDEVDAKARENGLTISVQLVKNLPLVLADWNKIREVLTNLVGNALKFTPAGGKIIISFEVKNGFVETSVTDTGIGISDQDKARIFQKFGLGTHSYVVSHTSGGTGLGLYISKSLVELHGGKMWFESAIGRGSKFTFSLPIATQDEVEKFGKFDISRAVREQIGPGSSGVIPTRHY